MPLPSCLPYRTGRLLLRPYEPGDRAEYLRTLEVSKEHFAPWFPAPDPDLSPDQLFDQNFERASRAHADGSECRLGAFLAEPADGVPAHVGSFNLNNIARGVFQSVYAGWGVSFDMTGRGLATEAVSALLDIAFLPPPRGLGLHRVQANIMPPNLASRRVAEKCGFRYEGRALRYLKIAGRWQDHDMFAKTVEEHAVRDPR